LTHLKKTASQIQPIESYTAAHHHERKEGFVNEEECVFVMQWDDERGYFVSKI